MPDEHLRRRRRSRTPRATQTTPQTPAARRGAGHARSARRPHRPRRGHTRHRGGRSLAPRRRLKRQRRRAARQPRADASRLSRRRRVALAPPGGRKFADVPTVYGRTTHGRVALVVGGGAASHTRLAPARAPRLLPKPPALPRGRARLLRPRRTRRREAPVRDGRAPPPVDAQPGFL